MSVDLRLGRWQDVLSDVAAVDAIICDPPYGARTHDGHDDAVKKASASPREATRWLKSDGSRDVVCVRRGLDYAAWTADDVDDFVKAWSSRCRGWMVALTSHDLVPHWTASLNDAGRYVFAPLPFFSPGSRVRLAGDGPSSWTCWIMVARPKTRSMQRWGTLPGGYVCPPEPCAVVGGKPVPLMRALVRDYSRPGDVVCDPFAGSGTTAVACATEARAFVGAEQDPKHFEIAQGRLSRSVTVDMFAGGAA
jgi:predicted RNA methylase